MVVLAAWFDKAERHILNACDYRRLYADQRFWISYAQVVYPDAA